ncbi:MAG: ester cyclase, partial [Anaerolineales bacterium]|nr:ester cyclase [Anaerolineales bacterium]
HEDVSWHGPHPINDLKGVDALLSGFWQPLLHAIPDLQRTSEIFIGGHRHWVGAIGYFGGTFARDCLGIPATGREIRIRFGEFSAVHDGRIILTYIIPDILDLIRQAGFQLLPPSRGEEGLWSGPMTRDGVLLNVQVDGEGPSTLHLAKIMCQALDTPRLDQFWDPETMVWYGPSGIGTLRTLAGFEDGHETPFRHAFPACGRVFAGLHVAEVDDGNYAGWVGWPSIRAIHSGEYLGCPPTGKVVDVRLMDFYRREGELVIENWVPIDMIHLLLQIGFDVFGELQKQI